MTVREELEEKQRRLVALLVGRKLDAIVLQRVSSVAWATGGATVYVSTATTTGPVTLVMTADGRRVAVTNNIEAPRLLAEEGLAAAGWELRTANWYEPNRAVGELTRGLAVGSDFPLAGAVDLADDLARLRARLLPVEQDRFRALGALVAAAMGEAVAAVRPGQTEMEIAALVARATQARGVQAIVNLVATDGRIAAFRHPLPTDKRLERYAMLVLGGRRAGLVSSVSRLVHFGRLPDELRRRAQAVAEVDAAMIAATVPGRRLGEVLDAAVQAYAATGFEGEWQQHHQGGACGYEPREYLARPDAADTIAQGQAFAWNPTIAGAKSEDTVLAGPDGAEVLTAMSGWPMLETHPPTSLSAAASPSAPPSASASASASAAAKALSPGQNSTWRPGVLEIT